MRAAIHTFDLQQLLAALRAATSVALAWGATGVFSSALAVAAEAVAEASAAKPNILLIVADDLGYGDLGLQGGKEIPTPHIDSIAAPSPARCTSICSTASSLPWARRSRF